MLVTDAQLQALILNEVGAAVDGADVCAPNIATLYAIWAHKAAVAPLLPYLYAKRHALELIEGQVRARVDVALEGESVRWRQRLDNLLRIRAHVQAEIERTEALATARRAGVAAALVQTAPRLPSDPVQVNSPIDPNHPQYRGDPIYGSASDARSPFPR